MLRFVHRHFMDSSGGIYTNLRPDRLKKEHTATGHQMLSESTALLLDYAVRTDDRALFDNQLHFLDEYLLDRGRIRWVWDPGMKPRVNSTIDDLLIIRALAQASEHWSSKAYARRSAQLAEQLLEHANAGGWLADFYDWQSGARAPTVTASYLDLATMRLLAEDSTEWKKLYGQSRELLRSASMGNGLFYKTYSIIGKTWLREPTYNAIDFLYTALHLAEDKQDVGRTLAWLDTRWKADGRLVSDYTAEGLPASQIESPAVYALAYRLLRAVEDPSPLAEQLYRRMLEWSVQDPGSPYDAGFVTLETKEAFSFDQLQALLAEAVRKETIHENQ